MPPDRYRLIVFIENRAVLILPANFPNQQFARQEFQLNYVCLFNQRLNLHNAR